MNLNFINIDYFQHNHKTHPHGRSEGKQLFETITGKTRDLR
jgi:hypothetical protein